jgi:phosphoribosylaminoimidazolecarboxamide formyltransferase / IMP cyclohydrolase
MSSPFLGRTALVSLSDKSGAIPLVEKLMAHSFEIISTGGTAKLLKSHNIPVTLISDYTEFPEILEGRVKTLHPKVFGGILARGEMDTTLLQQYAIKSITLVVANLYPFQQVIQKPHEFNDAIENIDIGGVSLIRAAAKNFQEVAVVTDPDDYGFLIKELDEKHEISYASRLRLAEKAFIKIAEYDMAIAQYFQSKVESADKMPSSFFVNLPRTQTLRYGENPHQEGAFYGSPVKLIQGKPLSYNNLIDAQAAADCLSVFIDNPACCIVKHANPCGISQADTLRVAYEQAYESDPTSAFGGIIAVNQVIDEELAKLIMERQFVEVIIAPNFSSEALNCFQAKPNIRLLPLDFFNQKNTMEFRSVTNGVLIQEMDHHILMPSELKIVTEQHPTDDQITELAFAWKAIKNLKSNAIVLAKNKTTVGLGGGQTSRVDALKLAIEKALDRGHEVKGTVMASDAFFPFKDSIEIAASFGITAIIQPGGSIRDTEVIDACNSAKISMVFTGIRHFRH